jgi:hypothetical protein
MFIDTWKRHIDACVKKRNTFVGPIVKASFLIVFTANWLKSIVTDG